MAARLNPRWFTWLILVLCIAAIPVGLLGRQSTENPKAELSTDSIDSDLAMPFADRIQMIRLSGLIIDKQDTSLMSSGDSASSAIKYLRKAVADPHVKGVLLRINSPGGTVPTSQELNSEVMALRNKQKPIVAYMTDMAASGGYYAASAADRIVAEPGTITGSIGVIFSSMNIKGLSDKLGLKSEVVKSGTFKDIGSPFRPPTPEEKAILQGLIADSYDQFVDAVAKGRKMPIEAVKKLADGRIYSGRQALKLGLVDQLGGYETANDLLQSLCQERYKTKGRFPVEEVSKGGLLSELSDLRKSLRFSLNPAEGDLAAHGSLWDWSDNQVYRLPLWLMQ